MIIGGGDIAKVLVDRNDLTFFASGVSNSKCIDDNEFIREVNLLLDVKCKHLVYFSTLSIYDKDTPYTNHKLFMEDLVRQFDTYTIIRLGNITWGDNPNTIINYFKNNECTELKNEYKYLCSLDEFKYWISKIPKFSTEMNITGSRIHTYDLYQQIKTNSPRWLNQ
jgi:hypothetical protein